MKIAITCTNYFHDYPCGVSRLTFEEAQYLADQGHAVWLVAIDPTGGKLPAYRFEHGFHIILYPAPRFKSLSPQRLWAHQKMTAALLSRHVGTGVDLVHGHTHLQYAGALSSFRNNEVQKCYSIHSPTGLEIKSEARGRSWPTRLRYRLAGALNQRIMNTCLSRSDVVTADSEYTKRTMGEFHSPGMQARIKVIPGWVDTARFRIMPDKRRLKEELNIDPDVPLLFILRRLVPRMGLARLLHALRAVNNRGLEFICLIGGSGPLLEQLKALSKELGLERSVRFLGLVPEDTLPLHYAAADAFILPTTELECFGIVILEALACGTPVLATPVAAIPEILNQVEPKWLSNDESVLSIAELVTKFLAGELPAHSPESLRDFVEGKYSRDKVLKRLVNSLLPQSSV